MTIHNKLAVAAVVAIAGLASSTYADAPALPQLKDSGNDCPEALRGASVKISTERRDLVVLEFTTPRAAQRQDLRVLVEQTAATLEFLSKLAALDESTTLVAADGGSIPPLDIAVKELPAGAQVRVRAERPGDATRVQALARLVEHYWDTNTCIRGAVART